MLAAIESRLEALDQHASEVVRTAAFLVPDCTAVLLIDVTGLDTATVGPGDPRRDGGAHPRRAARSPRVRASSLRALARGPHAEARAAGAARPDRQDAPRSRRRQGHRREGHCPPPRRCGTRRGPGDDRRVRAPRRRRSDADRRLERGRSRLRGGTRRGREQCRTERPRGVASRRRTEPPRNAGARGGGSTLRRCARVPRADCGSDREAELHMWRIRCGIGSQRLREVVRDRAPLEELVDAIEPSAPGLAAEALVELSQSYWADLEYPEAEAAARRAMSIADRCGDHEAFATRRNVVRRSAVGTLRADGITRDPRVRNGARAARTRSVDPRRWLVVPHSARAHVVGSVRRCGATRTRRAATPRIACGTHSKRGSRSPHSRRSRPRGDFDRAENHAHEAWLIQRLLRVPLGRGSVRSRRLLLARRAWTVGRRP